MLDFVHHGAQQGREVKGDREGFGDLGEGVQFARAALEYVSVWSRHRKTFDLRLPSLPKTVNCKAAQASLQSTPRAATGLYFLEPLIFANIPAFLWLGCYGWLMAQAARAENADA